MKRLMISLLGTLAFTAAAQTAPQTAPEQTTPAAEAATATQTEAKKPDMHDAYCLRHTGTRITSRTDPAGTRKGRACANAIGRSYTREELDRTGEINIADALRKLDPAIR